MVDWFINVDVENMQLLGVLPSKGESFRAVKAAKKSPENWSQGMLVITLQ